MDAVEKELKINDGIIGSQLAQVAAVNASGNLVTMDFIYVHPRIATPDYNGPAEGQVVSRVTMPFVEAKAFAESLGQVLDQHGKKFTEK